MITFGELNNLINNKFVSKQHFANDYILSVNDIINGKIYPIFKCNEKNPLLTVNGIKLNKTENYTIQDIIVYYQELDAIEIRSNKNAILPKGEDIQLQSFAHFKLYSYTALNTTPTLIKEYTMSIKPIYHIDNNLFTISNDILHSSINLSDKENIVNISATYRLGKTVKTRTIQLKQLVNKESDWLFKDCIDGELTIKPSNTVIPKEGGVVELQIFQDKIRRYYKTDTNGEILSNYKEEHIEERVTSLCNITSSNYNFIKIVGNKIVFSKQDNDSKPRQVRITAEKGDFKASVAISQERGSVVTFRYKSAFKTKKNTFDELLPTSLECDGYIPFSFIQEKLADDNVINKIGVPIYNMKISMEQNDWCYAEINNDINYGDGEYILHYTIYEDNLSKDNDRSIKIEISCEDEILTIILTQPCLKVIASKYYVNIDGFTEYNKDTINHAFLKFSPIKRLIYEDDSIEDTAIDDGYYLKVMNDETVAKNMELNSFSLVEFNGTSIALFNVIDNTNDGELKLRVGLYDNNNNYICSSNLTNIIYHNPIITTDYIFGMSNEEQYVWQHDWLDEINIVIKSYKKTTIDNVVSNDILSFLLLNDSEHFNAEISGSTLIVSPKETNSTQEDITETITLIQEETNKELVITLYHLKKLKDDVIIKATMIVHCDDILDEMWSSEGILYIKKDDEIIYTYPLTPCWLYPTENEDVIFQGYITLLTDTEYTFETNYFKLKHPIRDTDYNIKETIKFDKNDNDITFYIDL